jgi:hypothetical protein
MLLNNLSQVLKNRYSEFLKNYAFLWRYLKKTIFYPLLAGFYFKYGFFRGTQEPFLSKVADFLAF